MEIKGLLWREIQEIKNAIKNQKERIWDEYKKMFKKGLSFEEVKEARREFDLERNQWTIEGRCNNILEIIQKQETEIKNETAKDTNLAKGEQDRN